MDKDCVVMNLNIGAESEEELFKVIDRFSRFEVIKLNLRIGKTSTLLSQERRRSLLLWDR